MKIYKKLLFPILLVLLLPSCFHVVRVTSNTFADESIKNGFTAGSKFAIICKTNGNRLFTKEITSKISKTLKEKSYEASDEKNANYLLFFSFDMTSSKANRIVPIVSPGQSQTTSGNIYGSKNCAHYNEHTETSGTTTYFNQEYTLFTRELHIEIYDAKSNCKEAIWQGSAVSSGSSSDLRLIINYLISASFKNFGKDSKKHVNKSFFGIG